MAIYDAPGYRGALFLQGAAVMAAQERADLEAARSCRVVTPKEDAAQLKNEAMVWALGLMQVRVPKDLATTIIQISDVSTQPGDWTDLTISVDGVEIVQGLRFTSGDDINVFWDTVAGIFNQFFLDHGIPGNAAAFFGVALHMVWANCTPSVSMSLVSSGNPQISVSYTTYEAASSPIGVFLPRCESILCSDIRKIVDYLINAYGRCCDEGDVVLTQSVGTCQNPFYC